MHDWNVDPHMAVPTMNALIDAGMKQRDCLDNGIMIILTPEQLFERSDLGGRGGEAFPEMIRYDWMQDLLNGSSIISKNADHSLDNG